jgi:hypothetical protein
MAINPTANAINPMIIAINIAQWSARLHGFIDGKIDCCKQ